MALSASTNFTVTRDDIINRALRLVGGMGQNEIADTVALAEAALVLNMLVKEWEADGMQLWKISTINFSVAGGTAAYNIGIGATINQTAPLKVIQAFTRVNNADSPMTIFTKQEYDMYSSKQAPGTPTQLFYKTPGPNVTEIIGTVSLLPVPTATDVANGLNVYLTGVFPIMDFDTATDNPDFPSYYINALVWGLADQLSTEYGVPLSERGFIQNKAEKHLEKAKSMDIEEGSLYLRPASEWGD